ncbi:hypothetical protein [Caloranaerobacter azorensis]|uniref:Uncharacterized protein n=1 Tax=Caloranaerobacter azorensis TaxID=116090 RepID=A0A6P1YB16_9FIRM|nr:hypothetical protein [Caloranaerobacter azorensis]QIB25893.1 hypothetical protein G3A45_00275 [Caloranaerobacter azorensis]
MVLRLNYTVDREKRKNKKEEKDYERILNVYERCVCHREKTLFKIIKEKAKRLYNRAF